MTKPIDDAKRCTKMVLVDHGGVATRREEQCSRRAIEEGLCWQHHPSRPEVVAANRAQTRIEVERMIADAERDIHRKASNELAAARAAGFAEGINAARELILARDQDSPSELISLAHDVGALRSSPGDGVVVPRGVAEEIMAILAAYASEIQEAKRTAPHVARVLAALEGLLKPKP